MKTTTRKKQMKLYKVLFSDNSVLPPSRPIAFSTIQKYPWNLPKGKRPGKWMPRIKGVLIACEVGYHLCRLQDLGTWCTEQTHMLYEAEYRGEIVEAENKVVVHQARLIKKIGCFSYSSYAKMVRVKSWWRYKDNQLSAREFCDAGLQAKMWRKRRDKLRAEFGKKIIKILQEEEHANKSKRLR